MAWTRTTGCVAVGAVGSRPAQVMLRGLQYRVCAHPRPHAHRVRMCGSAFGPSWWLPLLWGLCRAVSTRERRAARALPGRAAVLSLSAPWQKSKRVETTTHRGRTRSNEPIIEGSRYKKVEARSVQGSTRRGELRAPPDHAETAHRRHSAHGRPQPSVITIRYPSRSYVTRYSTRGSPVAHAGRCSDAPTATPRCSVLVASSRCVRTGHDHTDTQSRWCGGVVVVSRYFYLCVAQVAACVIEIMSMRICVSEL